MKKWHIAALIIVGLIVAGIAYTMYEKRKVGMVRRVGGGGGSKILQNHQRPSPFTPTIIPGDKPKEPERPAGPSQASQEEIFDSGGGSYDDGWGFY